jgi:glutamate-1-semialdehyde 2,1-aminomutase
VSGAGERSAALYAQARRVLPGGVDSPVRAFGAVAGEPFFVRRASGARLEDEDGRSYLDYVMSWGPMILGHAHPEILEAVSEACAEGLSFGAPSRREVLLAERVVSCYPGLEMVRFVSSGTEAVMSAVRLARGATGRDLIVKFEGCYHGHADHLLVAAGSGLATFGEPSSAGVPEAFAGHTRVLPLDDEEAFRDFMGREGERVAAVLIEPVPANAGLLLQRRAFLELLREETRRCGALLLFDEVISGFRVHAGGAAALSGINPDLATFGKVIGGGMPVGAFGGPREIMGRLAPLGPVYQAGTLSGNPVAMAAGEATLRLLERDGVLARLETLGARLESGIREAYASAGKPGQILRQGSLFWILLQEGEAPRRFDAIRPEAAERYRVLHRGLLERGIYLAPSSYEVGFLSAAHDEEMVDRTVAAMAEALEEVPW